MPNFRRSNSGHFLLWPGCRLHGFGCRTRWGYDLEHTDSPRPYTVDELAGRIEPPHRFAYPTHEDYLAGWRLWLALRRDARPNPAEHAVISEQRDEALLTALRRALEALPKFDSSAG